MSFIETIVSYLPEVASPLEKKLGFKIKLKWTLLILVLFFILGVIPLAGLGQNALAQFEQLSIILGASFGSLISLGIGPIVTASIVLQLLAGSGLLKIDQTTPQGRAFFQSIQKLLIVFFIIFEAAIYVFLGGLSPSFELAATTFRLMQFGLVLQLIIGGFLIMYMDQVITKWGFGSGLSLFIVAGVGQEIVVRAFSPLTSSGSFALGSGEAPVGAVWVFIQSILSGKSLTRQRLQGMA